MKIILPFLLIASAAAFGQSSQYAPLNSPNFTGIPMVPTAAVGVNNGQIASTGFVASHSPCQSILDYGGSNGGSIDNSAAFSKVVSASPANQICVYFPPGNYAFSSGVAESLSGANASITIVGAGSNVSSLYFTGTNGLTINLSDSTQNIHVRDISLFQNTTTSSAAITINQSADLGYIPNNDFSNMNIRNWGVGILSNGLSNVVFSNLWFYGNAVGVSLQPSATAPYNGIVYNFTNSSFFSEGVGIVYGNNIQGVAVSQCNFTNGQVGIEVPAGESGLDQLTVMMSQFNTLANQIAISSPIGNQEYIGNLFTITAGNGGIVNFSGAAGFNVSVIGNSFAGLTTTNTTGYVSNASTNGVITGNTFNSLTYGVNLSGTSSFRVIGNAYNGVATDVAGIGSNSVGVATP